MSQHDDHSRRSTVEHNRVEQERRDQRTLSERIEDGVETASKALARGGDPDDPTDREYYDVLFEECWSLVEDLEQYASEDVLSLASTAADAEEYDGLAWFLKQRGIDVDDGQQRLDLRAAFDALASIAEAQDIVEDAKRNRADAHGLALKTGEHLQDWEMNLGDEVQTVSFQAGTIKTLFCGGTGLGKSCGLEAEAEDFYQQTFREGRDYKLIDVIDLGKGESWVYDIPQQDDKLRNIRERMGLPADFTESDDYATPDVEVRVPLTPGLATEELPYDTESEEFVVKPFVVPASDLPKAILVPCILSRVSDQQENTIRQAYDDIDRAKEDWSLGDLADAIRARDELSPKHKADAIGVLRSLQSEGFIRTREHGPTIDWRELFFDTETITVFSQAFVPNRRDIGQMICLAYLIDRMLNLRETMYDVPEAAFLMREFWEVAPHKHRQSPDSRAAAIQEAIGDRLTRAFRKNRDYKAHLLCDTQEPGDLLKSTREMFNRYVVYSANYDIVKNIFEWTANDKRQSFWRTLNPKKGHAGVVGQVKPAIDRRDIEYLSPVEFAPPSHHHFDKLKDSTGWYARVNHLEHEELRCPIDVEGVEWADQLPDALEITAAAEDGVSVETRPVVAFAEQCLVNGETSDWVHKSDVRQAFNAFLTDHGEAPWEFTHGKKITFGNRLTEAMGDDTFRGDNRDGAKAFIGIRFSPEGTDYLKQSVEAQQESSQNATAQATSDD